jgi:Glycosyltransferase family 87
VRAAFQRRGTGPGTAFLAATLLGSFAVAVEATRHVPASASSPLLATGAWRTCLWLALVIAFAAYAGGALVSLRRAVPRNAVAAVACAVQLLPLASPLLLSTDVYTYWDYGRLGAVHHANPYVAPPSSFPADPAFAVMGGSWKNSTSIYGPLFTWTSKLVSDEVSSPHAAELTFRVISAGAMLLIVLILWAAGAAASSILLVGWSPLFALHFAGGGHNDSLMMAFVVAAVVAARRRPGVGAVCWVAAVAVKWVAAVFLVLEVLRLERARRAAFVPKLAGAAVAGVVLTSLEYGSGWLSAFRGLSEQSRRIGSLGAAKWLADLGAPHRVSVVVLGLITVVFLGWLALRAYRHHERHLSVGGTGLAACQGWLNPWYALWGGGLLEFEDATAVAVAGSLCLSALVLRDALPV